IHYKLARVYQALGQKGAAAREFEISNALNRESHRKSEERTARLAEAEAGAKPTEGESTATLAAAPRLPPDATLDDPAHLLDTAATSSPPGRIRRPSRSATN